MVYKTKEEALDFLVRAGIIRSNERELEGEEKQEMWMILQFLTPTHSTNNQRFITEHYVYGEKYYSVTFFDKNDYNITEETR